MNRAQKCKILQSTLRGENAPLRRLQEQKRNCPFDEMTDEELDTEYERLRHIQYRQTGILPPPMPDFSAMTDEELDEHIIDLEARLEQQ